MGSCAQVTGPPDHSSLLFRTSCFLVADPLPRSREHGLIESSCVQVHTRWGLPLVSLPEALPLGSFSSWRERGSSFQAWVPHWICPGGSGETGAGVDPSMGLGFSPCKLRALVVGEEVLVGSS